MEKELHASQADSTTKRLVVGTLCMMGFMFTLAVCLMAYDGREVPDALDRLATFVVGGLSTMLAKTGVDALQAKGTPTDPVTVETAPAKPLETVDVAPETVAPKVATQPVDDEEFN